MPYGPTRSMIPASTGSECLRCSMALRIVKQVGEGLRPHFIGCPMKLLTAGLLSLALAAQQKPAEDLPPPIKVDVDVVNILVSVRDKHNGLIGNLIKDDFTVFEDGKQQTVKYFTRETDLPLTIGLLIDVSGSQRRLIEDERHAASQFFSQVLRK